MSIRTLGRMSAWVLALIMLYAGVMKWRDPAALATDIVNYRLLPIWAVNAVAICLPAWEVLAGAALCLPGWQRAGAGLALGLSGMFLGAVSWALLRGLDISCGCFGGTHRLGIENAVLDLTMIVLSLLVLAANARVTEASSGAPAGPEGSDPCCPPRSAAP